MTLAGYFNSMRELGGMRRMVDDDVRSRLRDSDRRGLAKRHPPVLDELTSRKSSRDIPVLLDRLEVPHDPALKPHTRTPGGRGLPLDVVLATNMVSVGVDIQRLGLMVVAGQPKGTAESGATARPRASSAPSTTGRGPATSPTTSASSTTTGPSTSTSRPSRSLRSRPGPSTEASPPSLPPSSASPRPNTTTTAQRGGSTAPTPSSGPPSTASPAGRKR